MCCMPGSSTAVIASQQDLQVAGFKDDYFRGGGAGYRTRHRPGLSDVTSVWRCDANVLRSARATATLLRTHTTIT
jgi:hypothetical protein